MFKSRYFKIFAISVLSISFYMFLCNINFFYSALLNLISVLSPLITGLILAFLNNILMVRFEKILKNRKISLLLSVMTILLFIAAFIFLILPELKNALFALIENFPSYVMRFNKLVGSLNERFGFSLPEFSASLPSSVLNTVGILSTVSGILSASVNIIIGFILSVYILLDKERFSEICRSAAKKLFKKRYAEIFKLASVSNIIFTNYIIGQLIEALILGILTLSGMLIFRLPYAMMISGVVCVTSLIPVFGAVIGGLAGFLIILAEQPVKAVWFIIFLALLQQIEGNLIYPNVMGKSVGLPAAAVIVAVTLGFGIAGVAGIILSVPSASVIYYYIWDRKNGK